MPLLRQIDLHCNVHGSDKVYHIGVISAVDGSFLVETRYGARGVARFNEGRRFRFDTWERANQKAETLKRTKIRDRYYHEAPGISGERPFREFGVVTAPLAPIPTPRSAAELARQAQDILRNYREMEIARMNRVRAENIRQQNREAELRQAAQRAPSPQHRMMNQAVVDVFGKTLYEDEDD